MKTYILTSPTFSGSVTYKYDEDGFLVAFQYDAVMEPHAREYLLRRMPLTLSGFDTLIGNSKTAKIEEVPEDVSFEAFWNAYGKKINRKRSEPLWNRMSEKDRLLCLKSIKPYMRYLDRTGFRAQKDPDGYLRDRLFETNWNSLR